MQLVMISTVPTISGIPLWEVVSLTTKVFLNANITVDSLWYTKEEKRSDDDSKRLQIKVIVMVCLLFCSFRRKSQ